MEERQALLKKEPAMVEYVPYGSQDKIKISVSIIQNLVAVKTRTGQTCSERDAIKFMAMCQAKRMNPFEGDCFLIGYDGKDGPSFALVTAHQTYLKRAELHPEFDGMKSGVIVRDGDGLKDLEGDFYDEGQHVVGGWATVFFKTRKQPMHKRLRLERFKKPFGIWQEDPAGMICKCAEADALRSSFPTMLGGLYLREELPIEAPKLDAVSPIFRAASEPPLLNGIKAETPQKSAVSPPEDEPELASQGLAPEQTKSEPVKQEGPKRGRESQPEDKSPIRLLRDLCRVSKIPEGTLLDSLCAVGSTDGSVSSLEELQMHYPSVVKWVIHDWAIIAKRLQEEIAKAKEEK